MTSNLFIRAAALAAIGLSSVAIAQTVDPSPSAQRSVATPSDSAASAGAKAGGPAPSKAVAGQRASPRSKLRRGSQDSLGDIGTGTGAGGNGKVAGNGGAAGGPGGSK
jgi:hypothetical protein